MPANRHVGLPKGKLLAGCDPDLQVHEVEPSRQLGDRMLHLQARVHFEEVKILLIVDKELYGAGIGVAGGPRDFDSDFPHAAAHVGIDNRRRRLLKNFLVPPLDGTFALAEPDGISVLIRQHLHLDVARIDDRLFDVDFAVAERTLRLAPGGFEGGTKFSPGMYQAHAFAAAAGRRFQHHGVTDALGNFFGFFYGSQAARGSGNEGHAGFFHLLTGAGFRTHHFHGARSRANKFHARIGARLGELRVFREEAIAGMNGLGARAFGHIEDLVHPKVRLGSGRRADGIRFVGLGDVERGAIDVGINRDGGDTHFTARADDAHRDLSPVGDQNLLEH